MHLDPQEIGRFAPSVREQEVLRQVLSLLIRDWSPKRIYLFGSRAKGEATGNADFDLAVEGFFPSQEARRLVMAQVEVVSGLYSIDVVFLQEVDEGFRKLILATGKVVYEL